MTYDEIFNLYQRFKRLKSDLDYSCNYLQLEDLGINFKDLQEHYNIVLNQLQQKIAHFKGKENL